MGIAELKYSIIELIASINDEKKLKVIYQSIKDDSSDWWDELTDEQKASVEEGLEDIKNGRITPHDVAMEELNKHIAQYE